MEWNCQAAAAGRCHTGGVLTKENGRADDEGQKGSGVGGPAAECAVAGREDGGHQQERAEDFPTKGIASLREIKIVEPNEQNPVTYH